MKAKHLLLTLSATLLLMACGGNKQFKIEGILSPEFDGVKVYLYDYYQRSAVDSTEVINGAFVFEGTVDTSYMAVIMSETGIELPLFVEPECDLILDFNEENVFLQSSPLNDEFNVALDCMQVLIQDFQATQDSISALLESKSISEEEALLRLEEENNFVNSEMLKNIMQLLSEHPNDGLGVFAFEYYLSTDPAITEVDSVAATLGDVILENKTIKKTLSSARVMAETREGAMFKDFTINQEDGTSVSLSNYVGKGRYVLVDFWASWCRPCRRSIPSLIELYNEYNPKGLEILSVAVWDKVEDSQKAIEEEKMPWPQILNAQAIPTEMYGISSIPHLILFAPDGTIVTRGLPDEKLLTTVKATIDNANN